MVSTIPRDSFSCSLAPQPQAFRSDDAAAYGSQLLTTTNTHGMPLLESLLLRFHDLVWAEIPSVLSRCAVGNIIMKPVVLKEHTPLPDDDAGNETGLSDPEDVVKFMPLDADNVNDQKMAYISGVVLRGVWGIAKGLKQRSAPCSKKHIWTWWVNLNTHSSIAEATQHWAPSDSAIPPPHEPYVDVGSNYMRLVSLITKKEFRRHSATARSPVELLSHRSTSSALSHSALPPSPPTTAADGDPQTGDVEMGDTAHSAPRNDGTTCLPRGTSTTHGSEGEQIDKSLLLLYPSLWFVGFIVYLDLLYAVTLNQELAAAVGVTLARTLLDHALNDAQARVLFGHTMEDLSGLMGDCQSDDASTSTHDDEDSQPPLDENTWQEDPMGSALFREVVTRFHNLRMTDFAARRDASEQASVMTSKVHLRAALHAITNYKKTSTRSKSAHDDLMRIMRPGGLEHIDVDVCAEG